jgi:hypothetical protein
MSRKQPPIGRQSERGIRVMLAAMRRKIADPDITPKELLQLLGHEQRLAKELKIVTAEKLRAKIAALDDASTSQSEVVGF